ncbi:MAG: hypothetical protein WCJ58_00145 [bacterium]
MNIITNWKIKQSIYSRYDKAYQELFQYFFDKQALSAERAIQISQVELKKIGIKFAPGDFSCFREISPQIYWLDKLELKRCERRQKKIVKISVIFLISLIVFIPVLGYWVILLYLANFY